MGDSPSTSQERQPDGRGSQNQAGGTLSETGYLDRTLLSGGQEVTWPSIQSTDASESVIEHKNSLLMRRRFQFQNKVYFSCRVAENVKCKFFEVIGSKMVCKVLWTIGNGELELRNAPLKTFLLNIG